MVQQQAQEKTERHRYSPVSGVPLFCYKCDRHRDEVPGRGYNLKHFNRTFTKRFCDDVVDCEAHAKRKQWRVIDGGRKSRRPVRH